jgi:hypothetical protein
MPVMTHPIPRVILYTLVTLEGSRSLSGTFFWLMITDAVFDLTPTVVIPVELIALNAYSMISCGRVCIDLTDLVEASLWGEDCDMSVISCTTWLLES